MKIQNWHKLISTEEVTSPALLIYPDRIALNISKMIAIAGGAARLRPHVKTHKTAEIIKMQMQHGIHKFKCATIPEAELLANCGAEDILLAMQPVGANINRYFDLITAYPNSEFSTLLDNQNSLNAFSAKAAKRKIKARLFLDLNTGMNRTGVVPGANAVALYKSIANDPNLLAIGLHAYDGHLRQSDLEVRTAACDAAFKSVLQLEERLKIEGYKVAKIVAGGSPTFPIHAKRKDVEVSPGTTLLWDDGYNSLFPEMGFLIAAVLLTRVISIPQPSLICLDLGHKSIAAEMNFPRVRFLEIENTEQIGQSEEHLVVKTASKNGFKVGDVLYAIPKHICPTVAKYPVLLTVEKGQISGLWPVVARDH